MTNLTPAHTWLPALAALASFRIDLRVDKRAVWNEWLLDFYVDMINATEAAESGGLVGNQLLRYVLPTVGFRAVL